MLKLGIKISVNCFLYVMVRIVVLLKFVELIEILEMGIIIIII